MKFFTKSYIKHSYTITPTNALLCHRRKITSMSILHISGGVLTWSNVFKAQQRGLFKNSQTVGMMQDRANIM